MTSRRDLLGLLGAAALTPRTALAQAKQPVLIGWLNAASRNTTSYGLAAFKQGMAALGWKEKASYALEERWAEGRVERLTPLAEELAAKKPRIVVAAPAAAAFRMAMAAPNIAIVQALGRPPEETGLATSLARPGGMVTGLTNVAFETAGKVVELLLEASPKLRHVGFLVDGTGPPRTRTTTIESARRLAARVSIEPQFAELKTVEDVERAFDRLRKIGVKAIVVLPSGWFDGERERITKLALGYRWPVVAGPQEWAESGALLSYGADRSALYRRAAWYVDRILKGTKPGDLPIEQPTKFELVVNMKTAKALGIAIPQSILVRADRVIE